MPPEPSPAEPAVSYRDLVGRGGPASGSSCAILAAGVIIFAFVLPWVSCANLSVTGLDLASGNLPEEAAGNSAPFLWLVPLLAVATIAAGAATILAAVWSRVPRALVAASAALLLLVSASTLLPLLFFYSRFQSAMAEEGLFNVGAFVHIEQGYWLSVLGACTSSSAAAFALATSLVALVLLKSRTLHDETTDSGPA